MLYQIHACKKAKCLETSVELSLRVVINSLTVDCLLPAHYM